MENQSSTTPSTMQFLILEQVQFLKVNDDSLLQWELVDVVDAEEELEQQSIDDDGDSFLSRDPIEGIRHRVLHLDAHVEDHHHHRDVDADGFSEEQVNHDEDVDDVDDDDGDLDDELVPWDIGNKLGRQRMRKLGKREFTKMNNSKRSPYLFVRPGCVRGKHGLGLKHSF
ncbi:uncharacterized protein [Cicer arietinum]|uniref:Uncharacterized protein LOC101491164 n=1 Tax=Cicer arietinum TaxID=3827 RepID=A0A1S2YNM0_CICAR|nr:uncharacterized protein LOC101491164 [Cicer arietinum]